MSSARTADPTADGSARLERRANIIQGEFLVTGEPDLVLTTLLGSCVAACMQDPVARVGGMNHFLLPDAGGGSGGNEQLRYGVHSMELLINGLLKEGARRERIRVWLFGGARLFHKLADIGAKNAEFAEGFVKREELTYVGGSLRGTQARRVKFWPSTGRVRQLSLVKTDALALSPTPPPISPSLPDGNDVDLF